MKVYSNEIFQEKTFANVYSGKIIESKPLENFLPVNFPNQLTVKFVKIWERPALQVGTTKLIHIPSWIYFSLSIIIVNAKSLYKI